MSVLTSAIALILPRYLSRKFSKSVIARAQMENTTGEEVTLDEVKSSLAIESLFWKVKKIEQQGIEIKELKERQADLEEQLMKV